MPTLPSKRQCNASIHPHMFVLGLNETEDTKFATSILESASELVVVALALQRALSSIIIKMFFSRSYLLVQSGF